MSVIFGTDAQKKAEAEVAAVLERKWNCTLHPLPPLSRIDYLAVRADRIIAVVEIKTRQNTANCYPDVFLNERKWHALTFAGIAFGCPGLFVVRFLDGIQYVAAHQVDASDPRPDGRPPRPGSANDIEAIIHVPLEKMCRLT